MKSFTDDIIVVRGGGDLATGVIQKLHRAGIRVLVLETAQPLAVRRTVALAQAVWDGTMQVEDMTAVHISALNECDAVWRAGNIPVLVDPNGVCLSLLKPDGLVDAILAKRNLGTSASMAKRVIALGPGFSAPQDAHAVVETMRGHTLGKVIFEGTALPDTGTPGMIAQKGVERVLRAPCDGTVQHYCKIGDTVAEGQPIFSMNDQTVVAPFTGLLRGLLREGVFVPKGMKTADIDPRLDSDWNSISDKARCIGGGVLEAYLYLRNKEEKA